jgi:hypothetical protein
MNKHRIMPLVFTFTFALFAPLLAIGSTANKQSAQSMGLSKLFSRVDRGAAATWAKWHEKNEAYTALVTLDQR